MDKYEAFAKALEFAENKICAQYNTDRLYEVDGAPYDFFLQYLGIKQMLEVLTEAELKEKEHGYYHAYNKAGERIDAKTVERKENGFEY